MMPVHEMCVGKWLQHPLHRPCIPDFDILSTQSATVNPWYKRKEALSSSPEFSLFTNSTMSWRIRRCPWLSRKWVVSLELEANWYSVLKKQLPSPERKQHASVCTVYGASVVVSGLRTVGDARFQADALEVGMHHECLLDLDLVILQALVSLLPSILRESRECLVLSAGSIEATSGLYCRFTKELLRLFQACINHLLTSLISRDD